MNAFSALLTLAALQPGASNAASDALEWGRFRGANGTGVVTGSLPDLDLESTLAWRTELPPGFSSPVLTEDAVLMCAYEDLELWLYSIDRFTGELKWRRECPEKLAVKSRGPNSPVSSTPVTDGEGVYVYFDNFGLMGFDLQGNPLWQAELDKLNIVYGAGTSPMLVGDLVILQCDQDSGSYLVAFDRKTGDQVWRSERPGTTHGFSTPVVYRPENGKAQIIVSGSYEVAGYSLEGGQKLWWVGGLAWQAKSVPLVAGDHLYLHSWMAAAGEAGMPRFTQSFEEALASFDTDEDGQISKGEAPQESKQLWFLFDLDSDGVISNEDWQAVLRRNQSDNGLYSIRLGGEGDVTDTHVEWRHKRSLPNIPSPVLYEGVLYVLKEGGIITSLDPTDGSVGETGRLEHAPGQYYASLVAGDGRLFAASNDGVVTVINAGLDWEEGPTMDLGESIWATPALGDGQIFVRTEKALYCFE